jgi:hypothetical protein
MFSHYSSFIPLVLALFIWGTFVTLCVTVTNIYSWFGLIFQISILMRFRRTMIFALCLIWYFKSLFCWGFDTNKTGILLYFCQEINIFFYYKTSVLSSVLTKCLHDDIQWWYFSVISLNSAIIRWRKNSETCRTASEQVKNILFERGCMWFQLFSVILFPDQNHPWIFLMLFFPLQYMTFSMTWCKLSAYI